MNKVTLGQLLDLIDKRRESETDTIKIMQEGICLFSGMTCWEGWRHFEKYTIELLIAENADTFAIWLEDYKGVIE